MKRAIVGIIPARYASSRLPGKPLAMIQGKSMIQRVYEQAYKASSLKEVIVATDDERIYAHVKAFGGNVQMTSPKHATGTDRLAETVKKIKGKKPYAIINIQGDEPFIDPAQINLLARMFRDPKTRIATLAIPLSNQEEANSPGTIKVVIDKACNALYFSRAVIPFNRVGGQGNSTNCLRHVGIYGYRTETLLAISRLKQTRLEKAESLEQLRWLENGYPIRVALTRHTSFSIDTPADLEKAQSYR